MSIVIKKNGMPYMTLVSETGSLETLKNNQFGNMRSVSLRSKG